MSVIQMAEMTCSDLVREATRMYLLPCVLCVCVCVCVCARVCVCVCAHVLELEVCS